MIRRERRLRNFTPIPNETLRDNELSDRAYRMLHYMLSMADDWIFYNEVIAKHYGRKVRWVQDNMKELEEHGYVTREVIKDEKGRIVRWDRIVHEYPHVVNTTPGER